jgi:DNA-binding Xre family transcriptional regulator
MMITDKKESVKHKGGEKMKTAKSILRVDAKKLQLHMAEKFMNPYDLCSKADISYPSYQRIVKCGNCKIATLGKLAAALGVSVTEILED